MPDSNLPPENFLKGDWKDQAALCFFLFGLFFLVFFSVEAIANWPAIHARIAIAVSCLTPVFFLALKPQTWKLSLFISKEFLFVLLVIFIGITNTLLAQNYPGAVKGMGLFLMTGVIPFWISIHLFSLHRTRRYFYWTCTLIFFLLSLYGVYQILNMTPLTNFPKFVTVTLFHNNPIPGGSILILMLVGPLSLLAGSKPGWERKLIAALICLGGVVLLLIGQRGLVLSIVVIALTWSVFKIKSPKIWLVFFGCVLVLALLALFPEILPGRWEGKLSNWKNIAYRVESLYLGASVFAEHPFFGRGMDASYTDILNQNYKTHFIDKTAYQVIMMSIKTFDNAYLTMAVEMGGLMVITYSGIFIVAVGRALGSWANIRDLNAERVAWLSVLAGYAVHSVTFDSFRYPALNFMFHSILALMVCQKLFSGPLLPFKKTKS